MLPTADQFREYLDPTESLVDVSTARFSEDAYDTAVSIGITDRRLLCVSEEGRVVSIGLDSICTIRSRPRTMRTCRGTDHRLLIGVGSLAAVLGFGGVIALTTTVLAPLFSLVAVGSLVAAEYLRRNADATERETVSAIAKRAFDFDGSDPLRRSEGRSTDAADPNSMLMSASGFVAVFGFLGLTVLSSSAVVVLNALVCLGGIALVDYAYRHRNDFDGFEIVRRHEKEVTISIDNGETVHIRGDPSDEFDRELGRLACTADTEPL